MKKAVFYVLCEPETLEIRYAGKTNNLVRRYGNHLSVVDRDDEKTKWVDGLRARGIRPVIQELEVVFYENEGEVDEMERWWISYLRFLGFSLFNADAGGVFGNKKSAETRRKISEALMGHGASAETRAKIAAAGRGRKASEETLAKLRARPPTIWTDEARAKVKAANIARYLDPELRARISQAVRKGKLEAKLKRQLQQQTHVSI